MAAEENCKSHDTVDVFSFHFSAGFLYQFVQNVKLATRKDHVLAFSYPYSFNKLFPVCNRKRMTLDALLTNNFSGALENIYTNAKVHELLLYSVECLIEEKGRFVKPWKTKAAATAFIRPAKSCWST
jgi:hypothetical protein